jgi:5-methylcytosine-specific restriction endonuclease McrA
MPDNRKYADRREALIKAVAKRRKKVKTLAVAYKGGCCQICGYSKCIDALEFHHIDSSEKKFGIGHKGYTRSWERVREELDKCILLCANCHREVESGITQLSVEKQIENEVNSGKP